MDDVYVAESGIHGAGVFAGREFAAGETVLSTDDSRVVDGEHPLRPEPGECVVVARRAVRAGEEISCDYINDCHGGIVWRCNCGSPRCRRVVPSSFFGLPVETQLEYLPLLNEWFVAEHREEVEALRSLAEGGARDGVDVREA